MLARKRRTASAPDGCSEDSGGRDTGSGSSSNSSSDSSGGSEGGRQKKRPGKASERASEAMLAGAGKEDAGGVQASGGLGWLCWLAGWLCWLAGDGKAEWAGGEQAKKRTKAREA